MKYIFICLLLLTLLVMFELFKIKNKDEGYYGGMTGFDYPHNDLEYYANTYQVNCMRYCDSRADCKAIVTSVPERRNIADPRDHHCWLKSTLGNKTPHDDRIAFIK